LGLGRDGLGARRLAGEEREYSRQSEVGEPDARSERSDYHPSHQKNFSHAIHIGICGAILQPVFSNFIR